MLVPVAAAALVLAAALAAYVMVKFYGVVFLGRPREPNLAYAHDAGPFERVALAWLAAGCVLLGLFPVNVIARARPRQRAADRRDALQPGQRINWLLLAPISADRSSYSPLIVLAVIVARRAAHDADRAPALSRPRPRARRRGTAAFRCRRRACRTRPRASASRSARSSSRSSASSGTCRRRSMPTPRYSVKAEDHFWHWLYLPIARVAEVAGAARRAGSSRAASPST